MDLSIEKRKKLEELAKAEEHLNIKKIKEHRGKAITFGSEVSFIHRDSGYFLSGEKDFSASRNTGYKCILRKQFGKSSVFQLLSYYKSKKTGDTVNVNNSVVIKNMNNNCFLSYDGDHPIVRHYPQHDHEEDPLRPDVLHSDPYCKINPCYYSSDSRIGWSFDRLTEPAADGVTADANHMKGTVKSNKALWTLSLVLLESKA